MTVTDLVIESFKLIFPAYCANAMPVIAGGGFPLDFGRNFVDGRPIFGKNKTFRGFFAGLVIGTLIGFAESSFFGYHILSGLMLSLGALLGDLFGAFLKRRLQIPPGGLLPVVDQVDFVVGAILFSLPVLSATWSWELVLVALLVTPPIHMLTNFVAYKLKLKSNPW
ncbi:CDP-2,3-bis-(O-geranylgeranyl)-sn-glycerol synthase [Candidatus Bathyarchaeota archaeon]|nr:CDP-2,3-bis-(O-geranylgeranyl)-sn-glycerol synthase [Candidatus Bathyarchaeota archaeon]